jgi:integrase
MLNCGMTQKDVSDLRVSEVDWEVGRIARKRSKTREFEKVPRVDYLLWPETLRLLGQERAGDSSDRVLLNSNGSPFWTEDMGDDEKYRKTDNVKNAFDRLKATTGIKKPMKSLKKTSASLIRNNENFASLESLFLGHAPQSMSDKHYAQVPQGLLDRAMEWLGRELGVL